jgi:hypothetical protein
MMNLEPLIKLIQKHDLENYQQDILATVKPAISIHLSNPGIGNLGQSRIGGHPDLPASIAWPFNTKLNRPLCFMLQINLAELPPINSLPSTGMLYLFLDESENDAQQLIFYWGHETLQPSQLPKGTQFITDWYDDLIAHTLAFHLFADLPRWATSDHSALEEKLNAKGEDALNNLLNELPVDSASYISRKGIGKLLGHVSGIGHDPREDAFVVRQVNPKWLYKYSELRNNNVDLSKATAWQNLLELHTDDAVNVMFGDAGYMNILIHQHDLDKLDFSKVYVNLESS